MPQPTDTIAAIATPPGAGGLGIVRISGPDVPAMARRLLGRVPEPRLATLATFRDATGRQVDSGIALYFPAPNSFTGEHVLELQGHGGLHVLQAVLRVALEQGARLARPGEFSERAFLNDKIDLVQAEAIADLVESGTEAAARAAQRSLQGVFSEKVHGLQAGLTDLRVFVEASIDFPDEEIDFLADSDVSARLQAVTGQVDQVLQEARQGCLLRDGLDLAIIGRPNAGKSSLLNALSGQDSAIVTDIPGTTRDLLRERIDIEGIPVHVVDTAGIRDTEDTIEVEGVRRARQALQSADIVLLVRDVSRDEPDDGGLESEIPATARLIRVHNKIDLVEEVPGQEGIAVSARSGEGMDRLRRAIVSAAGASEMAEGSFSARQRHVEALERCRASLARGAVVLSEGAGELLAEELRQAQQALGEITGEMLPDDLLGAIFSSFCIGK